MIAGHLSNFYFDLGEKYGMKFVRAKANEVTDLKEFCGTAEPHFVIYLVRTRGPRRHSLNACYASPLIVSRATLSFACRRVVSLLRPLRVRTSPRLSHRLRAKHQAREFACVTVHMALIGWLRD